MSGKARLEAMSWGQLLLRRELLEDLIEDQQQLLRRLQARRTEINRALLRKGEEVAA